MSAVNLVVGLRFQEHLAPDSASPRYLADRALSLTAQLIVFDLTE